MDNNNDLDGRPFEILKPLTTYSIDVHHLTVTWLILTWRGQVLCDDVMVTWYGTGLAWQQGQWHGLAYGGWELVWLWLWYMVVA